MPDRMEELKRMVQNINIHDDNRKLLQLIVEELDMLRGRTETSERLFRALRKEL